MNDTIDVFYDTPQVSFEHANDTSENVCEGYGESFGGGSDFWEF